MQTLLILGAGMSASSLIRYVLERAEKYDWEIRIVDKQKELIERKTNGHPRAVALTFDALNPAERLPEIKRSDLVISMLPPRFHPDVARECIAHGKHLITPSYISSEMAELDDEAKKADVLIMNEIGVDPGIDHMSAMAIIHKLKNEGAEITAFKSFCGGLIAPESDDNPWNYKFTWNPRNVVLAGQGGASCFIDHNEYKYIPYHRLFSRLIHVNVDGFGDFEGYANRDSLAYRKTYGIESVPTIFRGTLRRPDFSTAWNVFIELGMTDDSYKMERSEELTPRNFINAFLPYVPNMPVEEKFKLFLGKSRLHLFERFDWLGLFDGEKVFGLPDASPAQLLQQLLETKWVLNPTDKDMLVMVHEFEYIKNGKTHQILSSMVNIGEDQTYTAMSNTVGLPVGIAAKLILLGKIDLRGVTLPIQPEVYTPILEELSELGIQFTEKEQLLS
jgi:saccharopine dehydrogenase-like NADP-dependent oxidoreductase